ncbi:hypothetical protein AB1N83_013503, partial [Pleurotus pulmonarius]
RVKDAGAGPCLAAHEDEHNQDPHLIVKD